MNFFDLQCYKIEESALVGTAKLTKTVEVLSALIQTAVDLLRTDE